MMCREWNWTGHGDGKRPLVRCQCRQEDNIKLMYCLGLMSPSWDGSWSSTLYS